MRVCDWGIDNRSKLYHNGIGKSYRGVLPRESPRRGQGERKENTMLKLEHLAWAVPGGEDIIKEIDLELGDGKLCLRLGH